MAAINALDEHGSPWIVLEGDPAWEWAETAKTKLLLTQPVLPRQLLLSGIPIFISLQDPDGDLIALKESEIAGTPLPQQVSKSVILTYRAFTTQRAVSALWAESGRETATTSSAKKPAPASTTQAGADAL